MTESQQKVLNYLLGGALLGTGGALAAGAVRRNQLASKDLERAQATNRDDNVLYVHVPTGDKAAGFLRDPLAVGGAVLTGGTAAYLVNNYLRKKEREKLQQELDEAQQIHVGGLVDEAGLANKAAGLGWGLTGGAGLLLALASAGLANKALDKSFPVARAPGANRLRPKRIVVLDEGEDPEAKEKLASADEVSLEENALLIHMGLALEKGASVGLDNIVKVAAAGRIELLEKAATDGTLFETADLHAEGLKEPSNTRKFAAVEWLSANDKLAALVTTLAASVIRDRTPLYCELAKEASEQGYDDDLRVAACLCIQGRRAQNREKLAKLYERVPSEKFALGMDLSDMLASALVEGSDAEGSVEGDTSDDVTDDLPIDNQLKDPLSPKDQNALQQIQVSSAAPVGHVAAR